MRTSAGGRRSVQSSRVRGSENETNLELTRLRPLLSFPPLQEECHFLYDPQAQYPRIFNDLFTFKSSSHLLKLSLAHALAQSTKLSVYETAVQATLAGTSYIPQELAKTGELSLSRKEAVKLTGRLFKLRVEVNLVSNVLGESAVLSCLHLLRYGVFLRVSSNSETASSLVSFRLCRSPPRLIFPLFPQTRPSSSGRNRR